MLEKIHYIINMKKTFLFAIIFLTAISASFALQKKEFRIVSEAFPQEETYVMYIGDFDWGAGISKFVIQTKKEFAAEEIKAEDFEIDIYAKLRTARLFPIRHKNPPVSKAYLCDVHGNEIENGSGRYIALEINSREDEKDTHAFNNTVIFDMDAVGNVHIENDELDIDIEKCAGYVNKNAALFEIASSTYNPSEKSKDAIEMKYAYFLPDSAKLANEEKIGAKKIPLIVWFHGVSEGGTNPYMPLLGGQRAVNLATEKIQSHFENGAAVLVPLSKTSFMEISKTSRSGNRLWSIVDKSNERTTSYYTNAVMNIIEKFAAQNPQIDTDRIYLGGASAGGYMVINMLLEFPGKFAAAFPASEAYSDKNISDEDLEILKEAPLWIAACKDDKIIDAEKFSIATYERLKNAGSKDLHFSLYDKVSVGNEEYNPHCAWIYVLRDEVFEDELNLFDWLAAQKISQ